MCVTQGNFINRSLKFVEKFFDSVVPEPSDQGQDIVAALGKELTEKTRDYINKLEKIQIRAALFAAMDISGTGNKFLQVSQHEAPIYWIIAFQELLYNQISTPASPIFNRRISCTVHISIHFHCMTPIEE